MGRQELDGKTFDEYIQEEARYSLVYDSTLTRSTARWGERSIFGTFKCYKCGKPRKWISGKISTELWLSKDGKRYRSKIHTQKCRGCEDYTEPEIDTAQYAKRVVSTFDLWKNLRKRLPQDENYKRTKPHDQERCHGCIIGICQKK